MGGYDREEIICAAQLEGPGQSFWSKSLFTVAAVRRSDRLEATASLADVQYTRPRELWNYSHVPRSENEAIDLVRAIAEHPVDFLEKGRTLQTGIKVEALKSLFEGLKLTYKVDTTQGAGELARDAITVGMGRYLSAEIEKGADLDERLTKALERYLSLAPFSFGYWAPFKRIFKLLETREGAGAILAVALARIDGHLERVVNASAPDKLDQFVRSTSAAVAGPETIAYLKRRGRRWFRRLGRRDPSAYVHAAAAFLRAVDTQGAQRRTSNRFILSEILYGRGATDATHGRGPLSLPSEPNRYSKRWDRFPTVWDRHIDLVQTIWAGTRQNGDIQAWAYNVLRSQRQVVPPLSKGGLQLALLGPSERLRSYACTQIASAPETVRVIEALALQVLLRFCTDRQFAAIYPALEMYAGEKSIDDAVFAYISENGMPEIRRGALPVSADKRSAMLLRFSLRFMRSRFDAGDTYQLARYVGLTTKFKPVSLWQGTLKALPLKSLVELRLQLTDLPRAVVTAIDAACLTAAIEGSGDENLAAALTLSPSKELRELGWSLLSNAGDSTIATVWGNLILQAGTPTGLEVLVESLRNRDRVKRIERHSAAVQLLSNLVLASAVAEPKISERLFLRLAAINDSPQTLDTLIRTLRILKDNGWALRPQLLQKTVGLDPGITRLVWDSLEGGQSPVVAEIYLQVRSLAKVMIGAVDVDDIKRIGSVQASYLMRALHSAPSRLLDDKAFAVSCAICPHPELQQFAIAKLESRGLVNAVFIPLAESGMPAAVAAAERYIASISDRTDLTRAIVTICDSGRAEARAIGLRLIRSLSDRLDMNAAVTALAEHTDPAVGAVVAEWAASGLAVRRETLEHFDNRVLRTRRVGRKAKELVKSRLSTKAPEGSVPIGTELEIDGRRIQALIDMARGSSLRDRDWALQQLARLALEGHSVPQVQVSVTS